MISTTTIIINRPNNNVPFFYDSAYYAANDSDYSTHWQTAVAEGLCTAFSNIISEDGSMSVRVLTYSSPEAKIEFCSRVYGAHPQYLAIRQAYCDEHGHTLTIIED